MGVGIGGATTGFSTGSTGVGLAERESSFGVFIIGDGAGVGSGCGGGTGNGAGVGTIGDSGVGGGDATTGAFGCKEGQSYPSLAGNCKAVASSLMANM